MMIKRKIIYILLFSILMLSGCNSKYNKLIDLYEKSFNEIVIKLDENSLNKSIENNNLVKKYDQIESIMRDVEKEVRNPENSEFVSLKSNHEALKYIINQGTNWDKLSEVEQAKTKITLMALKDSIKLKQQQ